MKLIFEKSVPGRRCSILPRCDVEEVQLPQELRRQEAPALPELSEVDLSRHYTELCQHVHGVNCGFYPLGSCTMKYNPRIDEEMAALPGFAGVHPLAPEGLLTGLVGVLHDTDSALGSSEGLVARQKGKALALIAEEHGPQIAVTQTHLPVLGHGAVDAEGLQAHTDHLGGLGSGLDAGLQGDSCAHGIRPAGVFKADGLDALDDLIGVEALGLADLPALLHGANAILSEDAIDLVDSSFVAFKQCHFLSSSYSCRGSMYLAAFSNWP